jgi:hypothetical protein
VRGRAKRAVHTTEPGVESGQHEQRQQRRADEATDDDGRERALHLGAGVRRKRHWQEAEAGDGRGHQHRAKPCHRGLPGHGSGGEPFFASLPPNVPLIILGATVCFSRKELTSHGSPARGLAADVVVLPLHTRY